MVLRTNIRLHARGCFSGCKPPVTHRYTFANRAVVCTADLSAENLTSLHTDHWLQNTANVMLLELGASKAWVEGPEAVGSPREAKAIRPRVGPGPRSPGSVAWWRGGGNL